MRIRQRVLVTGAQGFVGRRLCAKLVEAGYSVRAAVRSVNGLHGAAQVEWFETGDLGSFNAWSSLLEGVTTVIHLIARTHITDEYGDSAISEYRRTNVDLTRRLASAAVRAGTSRVIYMSSIKAVGNGSVEAYSESTPCRPEDSYGISKLEAERTLAETVRGSDCEYTILRPPLVYGVGVCGNFLRLLQLVRRGVPLPGVKNSRSMVHLENLVDATIRCLHSDAARNELFHVADPEPISTGDLVRCMAHGQGRTPLLVPLPRVFLAQLANVFGKGDEMKRLVGSLSVSSDKIGQRLGWMAKLTTEEGVVDVSRAFATNAWGHEPASDIGEGARHAA